MTTRDWSKARDRNRIARHGTEDVGGISEAEFMRAYHAPLGKRPRRVSKSTARRELERVMEAASGAPRKRTIKCLCGHAAMVIIPAGVTKPRFKCSMCGRRIG